MKDIGEVLSKKIKNFSTNHHQLLTLFFFILGLLLTLSIYITGKNYGNVIEHSGVLGYYLYLIFFQLFGIGSYWIGPIYLLLSTKSFLKKNIIYIKKGFWGSILFLFSFSFLLSMFDYPKSGFAGQQLSLLGTFLFGKTGSFIMALILFIISLFQIFSISIEDIKSIFKKQKTNRFSFSWLTMIPLIFPIFTLLIKKLEQYRKKRKEIKNTNKTSKQPYTNSRIPHKEATMKFFKGFLNHKTYSKPPWIKKIEIIEKKDTEETYTQPMSKKETPLEENSLNPLKSNISVEHSTSPIQKEEVFVAKDKQFIESSLISSNSFSLNKDEATKKPEKTLLDSCKYDHVPKNKIHIWYESDKNRFLFRKDFSSTFISKKKSNSDVKEHELLEDFHIESDILSLIPDIPKKTIEKTIHPPITLSEEFSTPKKETSEINHKNLQDITWNSIKNPDSTTHQMDIKESTETSPQKDMISKKEIHEEENDSKAYDTIPITETPKEKPYSHIEIFPYSEQKMHELQEKIIASQSLSYPYHLSLQNIKTKPTSFSMSEISIQQEIQENWNKLETVLEDYGIKGQVVGATRGPMITMFEVRLEAGVRVNKILNLQDEIRMNLAAVSVRILAPIPGKTTIGIEIPNKNREFVSLGELIQNSSEFFSKKRKLNIPLGKDISGKIRYIDLSRLPHLLIAGATGSGKSVFMNSIIASFLYQYSPEQIRFLMIDPKMVELKLYEGIPHLLYPVIIDIKLAEKALHWAVNEMENRYKLFSLAKCRDIRSYNEKVKKGQISGSPIPYIIIFIDELSDLMMVSAKEVEESIIRLTQKARAVGIHMIMATQRPSVDVITALIKANCPARVAFQVAQKVDSRIILDINGAESLLGRGDMLYRSPASTIPIRIQTPNITEEEIEAIVQETQKYGFFDYIELPQEEADLEVGLNPFDEELLNKAWKIILETGKTSTSYIQRRLRIGYNRAANIMEKLEELGYLSPAIGNKPREILKRE